MSEELMNFDMPQSESSIIKVIGVGGGGSNAVNYMYGLGIKDVNFVVCNTDAQALESSPVPVKIQLGESLTEGRGAGNKPDKGRESAIENLEDVVSVLNENTKMVFVTAGMGGGTGTGAAPIIAKTAKEMGILTVGIVTIPFRFEGKLRINQALDGIAEMEKNVDSLLIINNERLREMFGDLKLSNAFSKADDVLATAAKGIAEIITVHGYINVDFADVETVMKESGVAVMGSAYAEGETRALDAIQASLESPLLNNNEIQGARNILLNITSGIDEVTMDEVGEVTDYVQEVVGDNASIIWGTGTDETLGKQVCVTIIATGFVSEQLIEHRVKKNQDKVTRFSLDEEGEITAGPSSVEDSVPELSSEINEERGRVIDFDTVDQKKQERMDSFYQPVVPQSRKSEVDHFNPSADNFIDEGFEAAGASYYKAKMSQEEMEDERYIEQIENVPAYKRRQMPVGDQQANTRISQEKKVSRFSLSDDPKNGPQISKDNPYLHDNVD
ncbi:cell division protein FtsZ [Carboxylicivirga sp. M1479]|uniref:cell division protein FtsZ n=1 Tax=Carboxylicivirga sp. M1479 TaxID=2594476 RepID=UPI001178A33E|nr:cell division protein FtsZ [Carboxylicivirga sp. M1479]TRX71873.1 cell division protein FtsZ [Carboxylicivirga sp. M1479]